MRKYILVVTYGDKIETWGNLKEICDVHNLKYWTLVKKQFPLTEGDFTIKKVPFRQKAV